MITRNTTSIIQITTCDPTTRTIQGQMKDQSGPISITIKDIPMVFRWPEVGEMWRVQQRSNNWYLAGRIALASDNSFIENLDTGQIFLDGSAAFLNDGSQVITNMGQTGEPGNDLGNVGEFYFRSDTPTVANQRIYIKINETTWVGIV